MWSVLDQPENQGHVIYQPRRWYNGFDLGDPGRYEIYEGDMLVHLKGVDGEQRKEAAVHWWLSNIEQNSHLSLKISGYQEKVQVFWEVQKTAKELLQQSQKRSHKLRLHFNEVKDAEAELGNYIRFAAFDLEGMIGAIVMLQRAYDEAEIQIAEDHRASMVAAIALSDARLAS